MAPGPSSGWPVTSMTLMMTGSFISACLHSAVKEADAPDDPNPFTSAAACRECWDGLLSLHMLSPGTEPCKQCGHRSPWGKRGWALQCVPQGQRRRGGQRGENSEQRGNTPTNPKQRTRTTASRSSAKSKQHPGKQHPARPLQCPAPLHTLQQAHDLQGPWQSLCLAVSHILANAVCS